MIEKPFVGFSSTSYQFVGSDGQDSSITVAKRKVQLQISGFMQGAPKHETWKTTWRLLSDSLKRMRGP